MGFCAIHPDGIAIGGTLTRTFAVQRYYYIIIGVNSKDSRYRGFLPDCNTTGRAIMVYFLMDKGTIRWYRIGHWIN